MRIGSTVLFINGLCYQSYNWNVLRPLGELQTVLDSLEEYECDEISIIRPVRDDDSLDDFTKDIKLLKHIRSMTPISFGGGIRSSCELDLLTDLPVERLIFSSAFINRDEDLIKKAINKYGHQAIQCYLPVKIKNKNLEIFCSDNQNFIPLSAEIKQFVKYYANEIIISDITHEGENDLFDFSLLNLIDLPKNKLIITGGIGKENIKQSYEKQIASVLVDNKILHKENSIKGYKRVL